MATTDILSPRSIPAASASFARGSSLEVNQLSQLCSGNLDFLDEASMLLRPESCSPARPLPANRVPVTPPMDPVRRAKVLKAMAYVKSSWQYKVTRRPAAAAVLAEFKTAHIPAGGAKGLCEQALSFIKKHSLDDTFYIYNLGNVHRLFKAWRAALPRVTPFYAVKCNPEPAILKLLCSLGAGFDCASKAELEAVLRMGVPSERIIFAHPCKRPSDIRYAAQKGVKYTTFDTESELHKVAAGHPSVQLVLRIRADDPEARVPLGLKYGANPEEAPKLLSSAKSLGLNVIGVSFHVGSACKNLSAYENAIATARRVFDQGEELGFKMDFLDVGGGFTGRFDAQGHVKFGEIALTINQALATYFPPDSGVRVISEPGRFFAETAAALFTPIYGRRDRQDASGGVHKDYWLTDGLYGSFNCILYDDQKPQAQVVRSPFLPEVDEEETPEYVSTLWGPTCDSADYIYKDVALPELRTGDWLMFDNAGAYTIAGACDFNGIAMTHPRVFYVFSDCAVDDEEQSEEEEEEEDEEEVVE